MPDFEYLEDLHITEDLLDFESYNRGKDIASFDCGDSGLNEFLRDPEEVAYYQEAGLGRTTLVYCHGCLVGFFTVSVSALELKYVNAKKLSNAIKKREKEVIRSIPSLLVGRFAVDERVQNKGIGKLMMRYIVGLALDLNHESVAIRLLILEAMPNAQPFYQKRGFEFTEEVKRERGRNNRTMFFDLDKLKDLDE